MSESETGRLIRLELKYCERCGGLLVRGSGEKVVYCRSCAEALEKERLEEIRLVKEQAGRQYKRRSTVEVEAGVARAEEQFPPKKAVGSVRIEASEQRRQG